jgi:hypothetical protein
LAVDLTEVFAGLCLREEVLLEGVDFEERVFAKTESLKFNIRTKVPLLLFYHNHIETKMASQG